MVRLKEPKKKGLNRVRLFQFLMVRLKEQKGRIHLHGIIVSIPYGTIKSLIQARYSNSIYVSIPYGTIKSTSAYTRIREYYDVSIPYGTIKSFERTKPNLAITRFNSLWYD